MPKENTYKIFGSVQGVFFRVETKKIADQLGIKGYIKNEADGSVIVIAQGNNAALKKLEKWCRKGPLKARVEDVQLKTSPAKSLYKEFRIEY